MLQCTNTWRPLVFSLSQRSLKFRSKSNERSTSVSSHRNIWDYLRSDYRNLPFRFWQTGSLPCFSYVRNSEKELKLLESNSLWLARFDRKFLRYSHIWSPPHVINAILVLILGYYVRFWIFWQESFEARKQRLSARSSRLGLAGSQNSLHLKKILKDLFFKIIQHKKRSQSIPSFAVLILSHWKTSKWLTVFEVTLYALQTLDPWLHRVCL